MNYSMFCGIVGSIRDWNFVALAVTGISNTRNLVSELIAKVFSYIYFFGIDVSYIDNGVIIWIMMM